MANDPNIQRIKLMFEGLNTVSASTRMPDVAALSKILNQQLSANSNAVSITVQTKIVSLYATASVEMWHRSIHSLLTSASLTSASPLWASVSGYYSSHYVMRGIAHLLGYYQLFNLKKIALLQLGNPGGYYCDVLKKDASEREHKVYWKLVKASNFFKNDPLFYQNNDTPPTLGSLAEFRSDGGHRNRANYADHVGKFSVFSPINVDQLKKRLQMLGTMVMNDVPTPSVDRYPDLDSVQILAYHRILRYRLLLDNILPVKHRYWAIHRSPSFCPDYFNFSPTHIDYSEVLGGMMN